MEVNDLTAFSQLSPKEKTQFLLLRDNGSKEFKSWFDVLAENCFSSLRAAFIELHATKDIEAGEEIYFCYDPDLNTKTKYERHQFLGLDGKVQISQSPLIVDPKAKAAAEARNIPLASRMVLHLLTVVLLEEERLLDDWAVKIEPGVAKPVALFLSEYNHEIAELALAQDAWLKKLQVAFELYERANLVDEVIKRMFQLMGQVCPSRVMAPWA
ncbi:hypothetical protein PENFLA_c012G06889 [Penicillium flavigenum]|uniref:SET domain-containing protein n=1 Tax=Penicillium flavigenum TaxID=254877 RepID=A0A1V6T8N8_9EURO|nr:hypothetical protein PENFLA_c012G06889 [Penicillium flavigenum]